ncbi:MAG: hypothetical protein ACOZAO_03115 [Patescibacteria group bacterium]
MLIPEEIIQIQRYSDFPSSYRGLELYTPNLAIAISYVVEFNSGNYQDLIKISDIPLTQQPNFLSENYTYAPTTYLGNTAMRIYPKLENSEVIEKSVFGENYPDDLIYVRYIVNSFEEALVVADIVYSPSGISPKEVEGIMSTLTLQELPSTPIQPSSKPLNNL